MKRLVVILAVLSLMLAVVPAAMGDFTTPPETNAAIDWETAPPYQRNMTLDFVQDPTVATGSGISGAKYIGYDDPVLWKSDWVELTGAVTWNQDAAAVGIFDSEAGAAGSIIVHFYNWERQWDVKHLYTEFTFVLKDLKAGVYVDVDVPAAHSLGDWWGNSFGSNPYTIQYYQAIEPNPPWEELVIDLSIIALPGGPPMGSVYLTDLQIATECVPVPGATLLALLGLGAAGTKLRRFV